MHKHSIEPNPGARLLDRWLPQVRAVATADWVGWALAFAAVVSFSFSVPIGRAIIVSGMDPTALTAVRMLVAVPILVSFLAITSPDRLRIDRRGLRLVALVGTLNGIAMVVFFRSLEWLDASIASMLGSLMPLVTLILLAFRGEKITHRHLVRIALGLAGVYLLIGPGGQVDSRGVFLALAAVMMFSTQFALVQWYLQGYDSRTLALYISGTMAVVATCWWVARGAPWHDPGVNGWLAIIILSIFSTCLARIAMYSAIRRIGGGQMALLILLEVFLTIIWSVLFLHERLTDVQWLGGILVLGSALLAIERLGRARWRPRWRAWVRL